MPIVEVEIVGEPTGCDRDLLSQELADAAGAALRSRPQGTWVKLRVLSPRDYAENWREAAEVVAPVFVSVMKKEVPVGDELAAEVERLTVAIAALCRRPVENVHIIYEPGAAGRVAFGGKLVI